MRNRNQLILGSLIVIFGILLLLSNVFRIDFGAFCWPIGLIILGVWLLLRPRMVPSGMPVNFVLIGETQRRGAWKAVNEEIYTGIGDVDLDLTTADIPLGETQIRCLGFIGDVKVTVPAGVGISVSSTGFISTVKYLGHKQDSFLAPVTVTSEGYETAERKVHVEALYFIADVKVR